MPPSCRRWTTERTPISKHVTSSFVKDCLASPVWRSVWGRGWPIDSKQVNWSFQANIVSQFVTQVLARAGNSFTHWQVRMSSHNFYVSFCSSHPWDQTLHYIALWSHQFDVWQPLLLHGHPPLPLPAKWGRYGVQVLQSVHCCPLSIPMLRERRGPNEEQVPVWLPPRSLLVLSGPARYFSRKKICNGKTQRCHLQILLEAQHHSSSLWHCARKIYRPRRWSHPCSQVYYPFLIFFEHPASRW